MPYKIVQTIEGRKLKLMTCPSGWEKNNILKYPKKGLFRYIHDENSKPEPDWDVMMCNVKRLNIATYDEGEKIITEMTNRSDTDDDAADHPQQVYKNQAALNLNIVADKIVKTRRPLNEPSSINLNNVAETMVGNVLYFENQDNMTNKTASILPQNIFVPYEPNDSAAVQDTYTIDIDNISESKKILDNQKQILENQKQLFDSNTAVLGQIETLLKVQNNILQKLSGLSVQLENAIMQITETDTDKKVQYLKDTKGPDNNPFYIKAIDSLQQLNAIEHQLTDNNYRNHLISTYSIVCSKGGKGLDCAYSLVDIMFTREFICQCSWSGGSRGDDLKVPLKGYKHVLSLFWEIIHLWDETFTLKDNENFFKTILKNAQKRKSAKCERASTSRKRPKKTCTHENKIDDAEHTTTSKERNTKTDQNEIQTREDESQTAEAEKENRIYEQEINQTF